jgi:hypothetical protein
LRSAAAPLTSCTIGTPGAYFTVDDSRAMSVPTSWFPLLARASAEERACYELVDEGRAIHWPGLDEDISVAGLLGVPD